MRRELFPTFGDQIYPMFTGIIESVGKVVALQQEGTNTRFSIQSPISRELKVDQSVSHSGVCLTVVKVQDDQHEVVAVEETLRKSNAGSWKVGDVVNLERCMRADGRFDGHIVQGHVDQIGRVERIEDRNGSWQFDFSYDTSLANITIEKGSIAVNGISLTCFNSHPGKFSVAIIPYTYEHTNLQYLKSGDLINLEFDVVGKYIQRILQPNLS